MNKTLLIPAFVLFLPMLQGCERFSVQKQLELYVEQQKANSPLPRKMSERQTLIDIRAGDKELIQVFTIKGNKAKIKESLEEIKKEVMTELHKKKNQIQNLIDYKIVMTFKYLHEQSEEVLHEFQVKPWTDL